MQQSKLEIAKKLKESDMGNIAISPVAVSSLPRAFDYLAVLRPMLLIPVWTLLLLGYYKGLEGQITTHLSLPIIGSIPFILRPHSEILITIFIYSILMGAIYIVNQLTDSQTDEINGKLHLIAQGYIKKANLKIQIAILLSLSIIISLLRFPKTYSYLVLSSIILGILYSVPPIRLKGKPILDLLANATGFGIIAFAVGWKSSTELSVEVLFDCLPYFVCVSAVFINTTIPDMEGDIRNGDITTGVFFGIRKSCLISAALVVIALLISWFRRDAICLIASMISLPFFIYTVISNWNESSPKISAITLATKVSLMSLSFLVAVLIPLYFILLIFTILMVRLYYQVRFGISYP